MEELTLADEVTVLVLIDGLYFAGLYATALSAFSLVMPTFDRDERSCDLRRTGFRGTGTLNELAAPPELGVPGLATDVALRSVPVEPSEADEDPSGE